ncbi:FkbM family methyltransferase [Hoeflea sp. AS16]|uniref:FkbM family methyltransferase n=1 Tax=unclassified Hoeflea TaxID=2614931 RepID=UPI00317046BE
MQEITINGKSFRVEPEGYEYFWPQVNSGEWEPSTYANFDRNIDDSTLMIDIGAWIGPTALYAAQLAKKCVAFEPDPIAFERLQANVALNSSASWIKNLVIFNKAVGTKAGTIPFGSRKGGGDSTSSVLFADGPTNWLVQAITLQSVLDDHAEPGQKIFLKIDIEGGEYDLIPAIKEVLANPNVTAAISLHPTFLRRSLRKSLGRFFGFPRFIQSRKQFLKINRSLVEALPSNKRVTINGKEYTDFKWFLINAFVRLRSPMDILITNDA